MRRIGNVMPSGPDPVGSGGKDSHPDKARVARFAETKMIWAMQVAADRETALRIALVWPYWLNSATLLAWPAQDTIAKSVNCNTRTVRAALKQLENRNHLLCVSEKRGGRMSNRYRIVVQDTVFCEHDAATHDFETGTPMPVTPASANRPDRLKASAQSGSCVLAREDALCPGTLEETFDKKKEGREQSSRSEALESQSEPRASRDAAAEIMREVFGSKSVTQTGHLLRK